MTSKNELDALILGVDFLTQLSTNVLAELNNRGFNGSNIHNLTTKTEPQKVARAVKAFCDEISGRVIDPHRYFTTCHSLFVDQSFTEDILPSAKPASFTDKELRHYDLPHSMTKAQILEVLGVGCVFLHPSELCAMLAGLLEDQAHGEDGILLNNGNENVCITLVTKTDEIGSDDGELIPVETTRVSDYWNWQVASHKYDDNEPALDWPAGTRVIYALNPQKERTYNLHTYSPPYVRWEYASPGLKIPRLAVATKEELPFYDLPERMEDREIRKKLGKNYIFEDAGEFFATLFWMFDDQSQGEVGALSNKSHNMFYVRGEDDDVYAVEAFWSPMGLTWCIYGKRPGNSSWEEGTRAFSPRVKSD